MFEGARWLMVGQEVLFYLLCVGIVGALVITWTVRKGQSLDGFTVESKYSPPIDGSQEVFKGGMRAKYTYVSAPFASLILELDRVTFIMNSLGGSQVFSISREETRSVQVEKRALGCRIRMHGIRGETDGLVFWAGSYEDVLQAFSRRRWPLST